MRASEYIAALEALVEEHGDLELVDAYDESLPAPEHVSDEGTGAAFVGAETA